MKTITTLMLCASLLLPSAIGLAQNQPTTELDKALQEFSDRFYSPLNQQHTEAFALRNISLENGIVVHEPTETWILSQNPNPQFNFPIYSSGRAGGDITGNGIGSLVISVPSVPDDRVTSEVRLTGKTAIFYGNNRTQTPDEFYYEYMIPIGDFDGDGFADMMVRISEDTYTIWYGSANGLQPGSQQFTKTNFSQYQILGFHDVDGDGKADIVFVNTFGGNEFKILFGADRTSSLMLQSASLGFDTSGGIFTISGSGALGDINGDGTAELIVFSTFINNANDIRIIRFDDQFSMSVHQEFQDPNETFTGNARLLRAATGDINGDGNTEIMFISPYPSGSLQIMRNSGSGSLLNAPEEFFTSAAAPVGDINGNGRIDFVTSDATNNNLVLRFGPQDLDNGLQADETFSFTSWGFGSITFGDYFGDLTGDGRDNFPMHGLRNIPGQPLALLRTYLTADGSNTFSLPQVSFDYHDFFAGQYSVSANAGDMNNNGYDDLVLFNSVTRTIEIYFGGPDFGTNKHEISVPFNVLIITPGDYNGNGTRDLLLGDNSGQRAALIFGGTNISSSPDKILNASDHIAGRQAGYYFPRNIGDITGNGADDFTLSSLLVNDNNRNEVYIFFGGTTISDTPDRVLAFAPDATALVWAGFNAVGLGDINGNGFNDFAVSVTNLNRGEVHIFYGNATNTYTTADKILLGDTTPIFASQFGLGLLAADFRNTGTKDLAVLYGANFSGNMITIFKGDQNFEEKMHLQIPGNFGVGAVDAENKTINMGALFASLQLIPDYSNSGYPDLMVHGSRSNAAAFRGADLADNYTTPAKLFVGANPFTGLGNWGFGVGDFYGDGTQTAAMVQTNDNQDNQSSSRLLLFTMKPALELVAVSDVPNDQGYWVTVEAGGWFMENQKLGSQSFDSWSVWMLGDDGWESKATINYMTNAASRVDIRLPSTLPTGETPSPGSPHVYEIMITAHGNGALLAQSNVLHAYALDNIAPAQVTGFQAAFANNAISFDWNPSSAHDLAAYLVWEIDDNGNIANNGEPILRTTQTSVTLSDLDQITFDRFAVSAVDVHNNVGEASEPRSAGIVSSTELLSGLPEDFELRQNYPNPFNPTTQIQYALPVQSNVTVTVYNITGQRVMTLVNEIQAAGWHSVDVNGSALSSGVYLYRIQTESFTQTRKMLLVK